MAFEILIIALVLAAFVYLSGPAYSFWIPYILIFGFLGSIVALFTKKKKRRAAPKGGGDVLEPIIIERKREVTQQMPEDMEIWFKPNAKASVGKWEKVTSKGPIAYFGRKLGQFLGGMKKKED